MEPTQSGRTSVESNKLKAGDRPTKAFSLLLLSSEPPPVAEDLDNLRREIDCTCHAPNAAVESSPTVPARMTPPSRISSYAWIIVLLVVGIFLGWINFVRAERVNYVTGLVATEAVVDAASPTGYAGGLRRLIAPEHNNESYQWIAQTQQMLARNEWRVRHVDYDNAPTGREVITPSPYRWWLGFVAWVDHALTGRPLGWTAERAALTADPLLQLLLLVTAAIFVARQFGGVSAALVSVGLVTLFPFGGMFLPGQPADDGLIHAALLGSLLLLLAGIGPREDAPDAIRAAARMRRYFLLSGLVGAFGLWLSVAKLLPAIAGVGLGALLSLLVIRRDSSRSPQAWAAAWRAWGLGGAVATLAAYFVEYFPSHLAGADFRLEEIHPLYGVAWLGLGELLAQLAALTSPAEKKWNWRMVLRFTLALAAVAAVPVLLVKSGGGPFVADQAASVRLSNLAGTPVAAGTAAWITKDGFTRMLGVTLLPGLLLVPAVWLLIRRRSDPARFVPLAVALGPALVGLGVALLQIRWWNTFDTALLALVVAIVGAGAIELRSTWSRAVGIGGLALGLAGGVAFLLPAWSASARQTVTESEIEAFMERDLAHWLAGRKAEGPLVVLAPPSVTSSLYFHGGLAGLGTPYWENKEGFTAAMRIAGASSPDEAQAVAQGRKLGYIVVPSWDGFLDEYARLGSNQPEHTLITLLHRWLPPRWLRPVPYRLPEIPGFEGQSVAIFKVVEVQDNATALSYLAEYFTEMGMLDQAAAVGRALERLFPGDLSVDLARAQVAKATGDKAGFARAFEEIQSLVTQGDAQLLPWDRRVALAIVLTEGRKFDQAREQVQQCVTELDADRLRSLTTTSLYRFMAMSKKFNLPIADPAAHQLALQLLTAEMREGL